MQREAINRVREMQKKSQSYVSPDTASTVNTVSTANAVDIPDTADKASGERRSGTGTRELFNIGGIKIDEEKALIALLIYILYKNNADMKLILGLGYLLI
jgi:hypothetical protein